MIGPVVLHRGERPAGDEQGGQHFPRAPPGGHRPYQPDRQNQRKWRQNPPRHRAQLRFRQCRHGSQDADGVTDRPPRHGGSIGEEAQHCGLKWREPQPDQERASDGDRCAAAARAFQKGPKTERDQHGLQAPVGGQRGDGMFHHLELPGLYRDAVEEHRCDDDPGHPGHAEHEPSSAAFPTSADGIPKTNRAAAIATSMPARRRHPDALAQHDQYEKERDDRQRGNSRGQRPGVQRIVNLPPCHLGIGAPTVAVERQDVNRHRGLTVAVRRRPIDS